MTDIFDAKIMCKNCNKEMQSTIVHRNGLELRAVQCPECGDKIVHPADLNAQEQFKDLKDKTFNVKLRVVGNSHAISIPKEIIDFISERQKEMKRNMDDMVKLCFDDFDTLKLSFFEDGVLPNFDSDSDGNSNENSDNGKINRKVRNDGRGNIDVVEEQTLNGNGHQVRKIRIRKIRRSNT